MLQERGTSKVLSVHIMIAQLHLTLCVPLDCLAHQIPLSKGLFRQKLEWVASFFFQEIFLTQGLNLYLLHGGWIMR